MKVYGDIFEIQGNFLSMMDFKLQYGDIYLTYLWNEDGTPYDSDNSFDAPMASSIDENCKAWEAVEELSELMSCVGADTAFWEDNED
jgi:hypothetical protein